MRQQYTPEEKRMIRREYLKHAGISLAKGVAISAVSLVAGAAAMRWYQRRFESGCDIPDIDSVGSGSEVTTTTASLRGSQNCGF